MIPKMNRLKCLKQLKASYNEIYIKIKMIYKLRIRWDCSFMTVMDYGGLREVLYGTTKSNS
jgi:hypothetical protein